MEKVELKHTKVQNQSVARQRGGVAAESPQAGQITQLEAMVAASPYQTALQRMADGVHDSLYQRVAQGFSDGINNSPVMVAQRMQHRSYQRGALQAPSITQLMSPKQAAALDAFDYGSGAIALIEDTQTADGERLRVYSWAHDDGGRGLEVHWHGEAYDEKRINVRWIDDEAQSGREIPQGLLSVFKKAVGG